MMDGDMLSHEPANRHMMITVYGDSRIGYWPAIKYNGVIYVYRGSKPKSRLKAYDKARQLAERIIKLATPERELAKWTETD
jgi:hypothetical protein